MKFINIGKIVNTHGIKGEVRMLSDFKYKDKVFKKGMKFYIGKDKKEYIVNTYRFHKIFDMFTFKYIHISSLVLGLIHTIIFFLMRDNTEYNLDSLDDWYYFFYPIKTKLSNIFIFIPYLIFLIISVPYLYNFLILLFLPWAIQFLP